MKDFALRMWDASQKTLSYSQDWNARTWEEIQQAQDENRLSLCTGLKTKDGKLLYEGDYVLVYNTFKEESFKAELVFKRGQFLLQTAELTTHSRWINYQLECIGNKFEHPGLLQQEDLRSVQGALPPGRVDLG